MLSLGTSDSFSIETSSARWSSLETRLRKASCSSSDAGDGVSVLMGRSSRAGYLRFRIACFRGNSSTVQLQALTFLRRFRLLPYLAFGKRRHALTFS